MKKLLLIIIIFLFSFSINAEEIIMVCSNSKEGERVHRYKENLGIKSIDIRREGGVWEDWGEYDEDFDVTSKLKINDKGAILVVSYVTNFTNPEEESGITNKDKIIIYNKYVLDFLFYKRKSYKYATHIDGSIIKKGLKGFDPNKPWEKFWECEKFNN